MPTLAQLRPGQSGVIEALAVGGALKRRLADLGFTPGARVTVRRTAPLGDPISLTLRGYELSLRRAEAGLIRVAPFARGAAPETVKAAVRTIAGAVPSARGAAPETVKAASRTTPGAAPSARGGVSPVPHDPPPKGLLRIALAGNPNCGKTTLFNALTGSRQVVGNWPGVTVGKKSAPTKSGESELVDLPGIYSLSPYSLEEVAARDCLLGKEPRAVLNIVDGTNLERNLYLTLQLLELGLPMVVAVNLMDEVAQKGWTIDLAALSAELGVPVLPVTARTGRGVGELLSRVEALGRSGAPPPEPRYPEPAQGALCSLRAVVGDRERAAFYAAKLLEGDREAEEWLGLAAEQRREADAIRREFAREAGGERREARGERREAGGEKREARGEKREARGEGREARGEGREARGEGREARGERREAGGEKREARGERREARGEKREARGERREARGEGREARGEGREAGRIAPSGPWPSASTRGSDEVSPASRPDPEILLADARYRRIEAIAAVCVQKPGAGKRTLTDRIDAVAVGRFTALPVFFLLLGSVFALTFGPVGKFLSGLVERFFSGFFAPALSLALDLGEAPAWCRGMLLEGVLGGVSGVLVFLPQIALLFLCLSLLEDSGYLARAAFLMDRPLRRLGLTGKSFIPMLLGFGCTTPAVMAARGLENERDRRMTMMLIPFMSCGARLPIYALFAGAFFPRRQGAVVLSLYLLGIAAAAICGFLLRKTLFRGKPAPFVLELPPYRLPLPRAVLRHVWEKARGFLVKAGTLLFAMSVLLWVAQAVTPALEAAARPAESLLGLFGEWLAPLFAPLGFGAWQAVAALLTGLIAKESVVGSLTILYAGGTAAALPAALAAAFTPASAVSFLVFSLLYMPCISAFATLIKEMDSVKWAVGTALLQGGAAYVGAFLAYRLARLILP